MSEYRTILYEARDGVATLTMGDFVALETEHHQRIGRTEDVAEAFRAFLEKRSPRFAGR